MNENLKNDWFVKLIKTEFVNLDKNISNKFKNTNYCEVFNTHRYFAKKNSSS